MTPSRRTSRFVATIAALASAALIAGCAQDAGEDGSTSADESSETATDDATSALPPAEGNVTYPLTLETVEGEIVIPERPERIALGDGQDVELLAVLGVSPVGGPESLETLAWAVAALPEPVEQTWTTTDIPAPAEPIAATEPDLILATGYDVPENYNELSEIAPVLVRATEEPGWEERLLLVGEALDLRDRAQQAIDDNEAYFEQVRADHPEFDGLTLAQLIFWGGQWGAAYGSATGSDNEKMFTNLGFAPNPDAERFVDSGDLSDELLGTIEGDVIVLQTVAEPEELDEYVNAPLMQGLDAVEQGHLVVVDLDPDAGTTEINGETVPFSGYYPWAVFTGPIGQQAIAEVLVAVLSDVLTD